MIGVQYHDGYPYLNLKLGAIDTLYDDQQFALSCFDDKRYIHEDGKTSYAYGHKNIKHSH